MDAREFRRRWRRIDWMLSAHATLRDRYRRRSQALTLAVIALSIIGLLFALSNGDSKVDLGVTEAKLQNFLAVLLALTFLIGLGDLIVDWRRRSWQHADAARKVAELKAQFAKVGEANSVTDEGAGLLGAYDQTMADLVEIPDRQAAALKARHVRKVEVFKAIEAHPGAPRWWVNLYVMRAGMKMGRKNREEGD